MDGKRLIYSFIKHLLEVSSVKKCLIYDYF